MSEESAQTKSKRHIVFRDKSNYSEILTQKFDLIRIFVGEIVNVCVYTKFSDGPENVVFLGPPGAGKPHLASALGLEAAQHRFSTYYINCHQLIEQLKKAHFENRLPDKLRVLAKYKMLIIDEIGYLPMDIQGANLFFQLIARRYEKTSTVFTSNKTFSRWNEVFADVTIASAILDRVLHHCTVINIKGESYRLKERKKFMRQKQQIVNTLFEQGCT